MVSFEDFSTSLGTRIKSGEFWSGLAGVAIAHYIVKGRASGSVMVALPIGLMGGMVLSDVVSVTTVR
jgi:hypothetical protein